MKHTSHFEIHAHQTTHKLSRITMDTEEPPSATLDDEVKIVREVVSNTAPRSQEQETKPERRRARDETCDRRRVVVRGKEGGVYAHSGVPKAFARRKNDQ